VWEKIILWASAILVAAAALVAGCVKVDVPEGPYVTTGSGSSSASRTTYPSADRGKVDAMSRAELENEVLRLTAENDRLRQEIGDLKRRNKVLDREKDRLEDRVDDLEDRLDD
jgi:predicted RNase H-like nuclease (RuvC/YqgF family)